MSQIVDDILSRIDIVDVVSKYVPLKRAGSNFSGLSPFKSEKTPSFIVSPNKQIFKDFSSGMGGNVITFVMEMEKIDFWDAIKILARDANIDIKDYEINTRKMTEFSDEKEKIKRIHKLAQQYFVQELARNEEAIKYLKNRRNLNEDIIDKFGIGFAPDSHYGLIQFLKEKGFNDEDILQSSLAKKGQNTDSYSFFRSRITFPISDVMGNIVGFGARTIIQNDTPKYINSGDHKAYDKSKILYGLNMAKKSLNVYDKLVVVEGYMDVIALSRLGFNFGVATCGTSLTEEHMKILKRHTENIYFLFDNDDAGELATFRALKIAYQYNIFPKILKLPSDVKDIDDLANQEHAVDTFDNLLKKSKDGFSSYFYFLKMKSDLSSPVEKQKLINKMFELILSVSNYTIQHHYLNILSEKLNIVYEIIVAQFKKFKKTDGAFEFKQRNLKKEEGSYILDREIILAALFYKDFLYKYIKDDDKWSGLIKFVKIIGEYNGANILNKMMFEPLDKGEEMSLDEMQIWWENQLDELNDENKRYESIKQIISNTLQSYLQNILKNKNFSNEEKQKILEAKKQYN